MYWLLPIHRGAPPREQYRGGVLSDDLPPASTTSPTPADGDLDQQVMRRLAAELDRLDRAAVAADIAATMASSESAALAQLDKYLSETRVALELVGPHLRPGQRILEIGGGIGFFAAVLHRAGLQVVDLEPIGGGFDFIGAARMALLVDDVPAHLDLGAENLDPDAHGMFDLIYSLNVLEHIDDWPQALDAAFNVLAPGGTMLVSCPNYAFPYDPHFGIPLVPIRPALTARILPRRIAESDLWASLNWITMRDVREWGIHAGADVQFATGRLADALERLAIDEEFRKRHGTIPRSVASICRRLGLIGLVRRFPTRLATPMIATITKQ